MKIIYSFILFNSLVSMSSDVILMKELKPEIN